MCSTCQAVRKAAKEVSLKIIHSCSNNIVNSLKILGFLEFPLYKYAYNLNKILGCNEKNILQLFCSLFQFFTNCDKLIMEMQHFSW